MKNGIAEGALERLWRGQKELTLESLEKKYAKELATAEPHQKEQIYQRLQDELLRQKNHKPSPHTLW
jgi:hypothetical protein